MYFREKSLKLLKLIMTRQLTYSNHGLIHPKKAVSDVLFDQVVHRSIGGAFEDSPGSLRKVKRLANEKKTRRGKKKTSASPCNETHEETTICQLSPDMFCLGDGPRRKKHWRVTRPASTPTRKKTRSKRNKRLLTPAKEDVNGEDLEEVSSCESVRTSPSLNIETCSSGKRKLYTQSSNRAQEKDAVLMKDAKESKACRRKKVATSLWYTRRGSPCTQGGGPSRVASYSQEWTVSEKAGCSVQDQSSIEIARDCSVIPMSVLWNGSPILPIVCSDNDNSLDFLEPKSKDSREEQDLAWVSVSSGPRNFESGDGESQYTYVSTYTYGSSVAPGGELGWKESSKSPRVIFHKKPSHLNSSVRRGKQDIQEVEFPDFISPVGESSQTKTAVKAKRVSLQQKCERPSGEAKCSTMLFASQSNTRHIEALSLTAIPSQTFQQNEADRRSAPDGSPEKVPDKVCPDYKQRASTPKDRPAAMSLCVSPVMMPSWDEDDLGPQIVNSVEVNTSEIIVPSLMEPTVLEDQQGSPYMAPRGVHDAECKASGDKLVSPVTLPQPGRCDGEQHSSQHYLPSVSRWQRCNKPVRSKEVNTQSLPLEIVTLSSTDHSVVKAAPTRRSNSESKKQKYSRASLQKKIKMDSPFNEDSILKMQSKVPSTSIDKVAAKKAEMMLTHDHHDDKSAPAPDRNPKYSVSKEAVKVYHPNIMEGRFDAPHFTLNWNDQNEKTCTTDYIQTNGTKAGKISSCDGTKYRVDHSDQISLHANDISCIVEGTQEESEKKASLTKNKKGVEGCIDDVMVTTDSHTHAHTDLVDKIVNVSNTYKPPLCFVNRLCMHERKQQKMISQSFRFSLSKDFMARNE